MKFWTLLALCSSFNLAQAQQNPRLLADQKAQKELSTLHFIRDGRGMVIAPDFIRVYENMAKILGLSHTDRNKLSLDPITNALSPFKTRWGLTDHEGEIKGFFNVPYKNMQIGGMGCIVCHSGKAAGRYYIGLGNKNIDVGQLASDATLAQRMWISATLLWPKSKERKELEKDSLAFTQRLSDKRYTNLTMGMVPVSMIESWFYRVVGNHGMPKDNLIGAVKVPHFWGYGEKRKVGQFSDGFGDGNFSGWGLAVELAGTQTIENTRANFPKIAHAEDLLGDLLPPAYPFEINQKMAAKGKVTFNNTCANCHGTYERDSAGLPIYKAPLHIPIGVVKTDDDRLRVKTDYFLSLVDINPLSEEIKRTNLGPGYFAPRLDGIWARFPYLHNASVPSIMALLSEPSLRPTYWSLENAGEEERFDKDNLGLKMAMTSTREDRELFKRAQKGDRTVYWVKRIGHSNQGHWFKFSDKLTSNDKEELIEYLKTL